MRLTRLQGLTAGGPLTPRADWRSPVRGGWRLALFGIALIVGYQLAVLIGLWWQGTRDERRPVEAILVLGAAQWNGKPSPVLQARLDHAIELYREGYAPRVAVTGGVGDGDEYSEASVAADYLRARGIPAGAILGEDQGRSSLESIRGAAAVLAARGISRVLLVSDPPHMLRILRMAQAAGLEAYGSPAAASPAVGSLEAQVRFLLRELVLYDGYTWFGVIPPLAGHPLSVARHGLR
ncbi:MAG TPA: YdcF family protein [Chloroflexota bacterium]|nr:YdcF family protein [Chloroflexota bacterium]